MTTLLAPIAEQNVGPVPGVDDDVEPDAQWKAALKARIEQELQPMADKVRQERDTTLRGLREGTREYDATMHAYRTSMDRVRRTAEELFSQEIKIKRVERSLALGKEVDGEEFEAFLKQQQAIWDNIKKEGAERPQGRPDSTVIGGSIPENGDPVAVPLGASGEHDAREGPSVPYRDSRPVTRVPGPEYRPRDRTQSGGSDQVGGVPSSYGSRPSRSRGNSSVLAADFEFPSPGPSPYDQSSIGRQGVSSLSKTRPQDIWLPGQGPRDSSSATSRTLAHATAPGISPISPNARESPIHDAGGRTVTRIGSVRTNERPSPLSDLDPSSSLPRDRFGMGSLEDRMTSRKGKEPDRSDLQRESAQPPPAIYDYYASRRPDSRTSMPITPARPSMPTPTSDESYFYQANLTTSARPRRDSDDREGIPVRRRSSRRSLPSDQGSPENTRYVPPGSTSARPIPNKRPSNSDYDGWPPQPSPSSRPSYGPQSPPTPYTTSSSRPIPRPTASDDGPRRHSPSGPYYGSQSPPDAFPFAGYDVPFSSSPRPRYSNSPAASVNGRRNSNGSRSVRSHSSRQEFWGPSDVAQRPLATYEEQSVASDSDSDEDYGMDLDDLWRVRERQELSWKLIRDQEEAKQDVLRKAEEARRLEEEARRKEEEARRKEDEARKKEEEARRQAEEARRKEEEVRMRALEIQQKEEELRRREAELAKREMEAKLAEERRKREAAEAKLQDEIRKRQEAEKEAKRREEEETRRRQRELAERRELEEAEKRRREREEAERQRREREEADRIRRESEEAARRERERKEWEEWEEKRRQEEERHRRAREEREKREKEEKERREKEEEEKRDREAREQLARERQQREAEQRARLQQQREESHKRREAEAQAERKREAELLQAERAEAERLQAEAAARMAAMAAEAEAQEEARRREADARAKAQDEARRRQAEASRTDDERSQPEPDPDLTDELQSPELIRQQQAIFEHIQAENRAKQEARRRLEEAERRASEEARKRSEEENRRAEARRREEAEEEGLRRELEARKRAEDEYRRREDDAKRREEAILADVLRRSQEEHRKQEERKRQNSVGSQSDGYRPGVYYSASSSAPRPVPAQGSSAYGAVPPASSRRLLDDRRPPGIALPPQTALPPLLLLAVPLPPRLVSPLPQRGPGKLPGIRNPAPARQLQAARIQAALTVPRSVLQPPTLLPPQAILGPPPLRACRYLMRRSGLVVRKSKRASSSNNSSASRRRGNGVRRRRR
ncbi:hypothetical protein C8Q78DRAFT_569782 [Trametes maxima]|nr:hypothetical protein C8Q78DRAFT_569782 [Trametes maxima]